MKTQIITTAIFFCSPLFSAEPLKDIAAFCILNDETIYNHNRSFDECSDLCFLMQNKLLQQKYFTNLIDKRHPEIIQKIDSFMITFNDFNNQRLTDPLSILCKKYAINQYCNTLQKTIEIPGRIGDQKVVHMRKDTFYLSRDHKLEQELRAQIRDSFSDDNSLILTSKLGEFKWCKNGVITHFVFNNSISAVSCGFNGKLVFGSYDGTVAIVDITQPKLLHQDEVVELLIQKNFKNINESEITSIYYNQLDKIIFYSQENKLYSLAENAESATVIFTCPSNIICSAIKNNLISCACADNTIFLYDYCTKKRIIIQHPASINTMRLCETDSGNMYLIIGDQVDATHGTVIIKRIVSNRNGIVIITESELSQNTPVNFVEICSDNQEIIIARRVEEHGKASINTIISYPMPDYFEKLYSEYKCHFKYINNRFRIHKNNFHILHKTLYNYRSFLYSHTLNEEIISLRKKIEDRIITIMKSDIFKQSINSVDALKTFLIKFSRVPVLDATNWFSGGSYLYSFYSDESPFMQFYQTMKNIIDNSIENLRTALCNNEIDNLLMLLCKNDIRNRLFDDYRINILNKNLEIKLINEEKNKKDHLMKKRIKRNISCTIILLSFIYLIKSELIG